MGNRVVGEQRGGEVEDFGGDDENAVRGLGERWFCWIDRGWDHCRVDSFAASTVSAASTAARAVATYLKGFGLT